MREYLPRHCDINGGGCSLSILKQKPIKALFEIAQIWLLVFSRYLESTAAGW